MSARMASSATAASSREGVRAARVRPGSPWMPIPSSTSASPSSKVGLPAAGTTHELSATPLIGRQRREALHRSGGVQKPEAAEAAVKRPMAGTAVGDQNALSRPADGGPGDHLVLDIHRQRRMRRGDTLEGIGDYRLRDV